MEGGKLGVGLPITLPKMNEASEAMIQSTKLTIERLDTLIEAYEIERHA